MDRLISTGSNNARLFAISFLLLPLVTPPAAAATLMVGPGQTYAVPSEAAAVAQPGDTVIITPSTYHDCSVWTADNLTIEASAEGVVLSKTICMGKAIFVVVGNNVTINGITFADAVLSKSAGGNGAGIRAEGADLTVENSTFVNDQDGILSSSNPTSTITITGSTFHHDGACIDQCAHGIYISDIALLQVSYSHFSDTQKGHHIKSRAANTQISHCTIEDGNDGTSSFLVDIPNGGNLTISNTRMEKGPKSSNHSTAISIGEEGVTNPTTQLLVTDNIFTNDGHPTVFVTNDTTTPAQLTGNKLLGNTTTPLKGPGTVQ